MRETFERADEIMRLSPVIPVIVTDDISGASRVAQTLVAHGLIALEVTLRTTSALAVLREMSSVAGAVIGAGTVTNERQLDSALDAGARFIVSPGLSEPLAKAAIARNVPFLPGVCSASDIMRGLDLGLDRFKFFPAEAAGGVAMLKALSAPFDGVRFCPTGGVTESNAPRWLALKCVLCVGGTWLVPSGSADLDAIARRARAFRAVQK